MCIEKIDTWLYLVPRWVSVVSKTREDESHFREQLKNLVPVSPYLRRSQGHDGVNREKE